MGIYANPYLTPRCNHGTHPDNGDRYTINLPTLTLHAVCLIFTKILFDIETHSKSQKDTSVFSRAVCSLSGNIFRVEILYGPRADDMQTMCGQYVDDVWMTCG